MRVSRFCAGRPVGVGGGVMLGLGFVTTFFEAASSGFGLGRPAPHVAGEIAEPAQVGTGQRAVVRGVEALAVPRHPARQTLLRTPEDHALHEGVDARPGPERGVVGIEGQHQDPASPHAPLDGHEPVARFAERNPHRSWIGLQSGEIDRAIGRGLDGNRGAIDLTVRLRDIGDPDRTFLRSIRGRSARYGGWG